MRRKDWKYYIKTVKLRWHSYQFDQLKKQADWKNALFTKCREYNDKLANTELVFSPFHSTYSTYFYFDNVDFFLEDYTFDNHVPISLKSQDFDNPFIPIYYGMILWNMNVGNQYKYIEKYKAIIHKTLESKLELKHGIELPYRFDYPLFSLKSPWISGITQSLATSFFLRMSLLSEDKNYVLYAEQFFLLCMKSQLEDGLLVSTSQGMEWVEEYPSTPHSYVLNGHIFAIIACIELFQVTQKELYNHTAKQWIQSLINHLPEYQYKSFLQHNLYHNKLSNIEYQGLYAGQFKHLYQLTQHPLFLELFHFYNEAINWNDFYRFYGINS